IELPARLRMPEQGLRLGGEAEIPSVFGQKERPNPETVACEHELAALAVPDRDREVAVEAGETTHAPFLVRVRDHLGVRGRGEVVAAPLQLGAKLDVVVDL